MNAKIAFRIAFAAPPPEKSQSLPLYRKRRDTPVGSDWHESIPSISSSAQVDKNELTLSTSVLQDSIDAGRASVSPRHTN